MTEFYCVECGEVVAQGRVALGYKKCLECGELDARKVRHCSVPMHKSGLIYVSPDDKATLVGVNNKGGIVK